jgi:hypothetical protein
MISSPKRIPVYGEIMAARWAYEGLATYQFTNNDFQKQFYHWDKVKSNANLKANFLMKELINKLTFIERNMDNPGESEMIAYNLGVLRREIADEYRERMIMAGYLEAPTYTMKYLDSLYPDQLSPEILGYTKEYLTALKQFYINTFHAAVTGKDELTRTFDLEDYNREKRRYSNEKLEEMVTNNKSLNFYIEYRGDMIQNRDPIYLDPTQPFIKAHFYAPRKKLAGEFIPTIWINIMVIWFMTLILYLLLYFRILKKVLDFLERIFPGKSY